MGYGHESQFLGNSQLAVAEKKGKREKGKGREDWPKSRDIRNQIAKQIIPHPFTLMKGRENDG
jgi:hypothetical protein